MPLYAPTTDLAEFFSSGSLLLLPLHYYLGTLVLGTSISLHNRLTAYLIRSIDYAGS